MTPTPLPGFFVLVFAAGACAHAPADVMKPVPADLDSAGTARWVAAERRACRGVFEMVVDEGEVARPDSTRTFHYIRRVAGVRCHSGE